jgi:effector-binding domain-containing protein
MKALKIIGLIVLGLVAVIAILGLLAPKPYFVERTIQIDAPKQVVFPHVKFWKAWIAWSPWVEMEPTAQISYEGSDGEVGAKYKWNGKITGMGEMVNVGVKENEELLYHLKFIEPMASETDGYIRVKDEKGGTRVAWSFYGNSPFPWNVVQLFYSMDRMVGKDFEKGLLKLKSICEKDMVKMKNYAIRETEFPATTYAAIRKSVAFKEIPDFYAASFGKVMAAINKAGGRIAGPPTGLYYKWDEPSGVADMAAAIPMAGKKSIGPEFQIVSLPKRTAYVLDYYGPYDQMVLPYLAMDNFFKEKGLKQSSPVLEEYITDPGSEPDQSKWLTKVYFFAE